MDTKRVIKYIRRKRPKEISVFMELLESRINMEGVVGEGDILKVGSFLNQQMDVPFVDKLADEIHALFAGCDVNKILTIEASGICIAVLVAQKFNCPAVFAKKHPTSNIVGDCYSTHVHSYTHNCDNTVIVPKDYLGTSDRILIVDDFLATGEALEALIRIVEQSGATLVGCASLIEKVYQEGGNKIRQRGIRVESLAKITNLYGKNGIEFENQ